MGSYPLPTRPYSMVHESGVQGVIHGFRGEGSKFVGVLFAGLMITADGVYLLEYNARFGDPETQVVLPLLENDLLDVFDACIDVTRGLVDTELKWKSAIAATVVMASGGYPDAYETGKPITGLDKVPDDV